MLDERTVTIQVLAYAKNVAHFAHSMPIQRAIAIRVLLLAVVPVVNVCCSATDDKSIDANAAHPAGAPTTQDPCILQKEGILTALNGIAARYDHECVADVECELVELSIPCQQSCQAAIRVRDHAAFTAALADYSSSTCPTAPKECGIEGQCA